jgi:tetratricopeptide (TPR) repeat protein
VPILVLEYMQLDTYEPFAEHYPFQIGLLELMPAVDTPFASGSKLHVYHQVYLPAGQTEMLVCGYRLEGSSGVVKEEFAGIDPAQADAYGTVNLVATLDLEGVAAGEYQLYVDLEGDGRDAFSLPVRIDEAAEHVFPLFDAQQQTPPTDPNVGYQRALQYRALGRVEEAIATLAPALKRAPDFAEAIELQTELLMEAGRYEEVDRLLKPGLVEDPNDIEVLLNLAKANAGLGRRYDSIRYYERARLAGAEETPGLLNDLAAEYYGDGQVEKARELLERSLQLDAEQPEIRRLLESIRPGGGPR